MTAHPFGTTITRQTLQTHFANTQLWEDRYRQLIQLAKQLPMLPESLKQRSVELAGCENRVWLAGELQANGTMHYYADSDGRIVRGLLAILLTAIEGLTPEQVLTSDPLDLFRELNLFAQLSTSRVSGLQAIVSEVKRIAERCR